LFGVVLALLMIASIIMVSCWDIEEIEDLALISNIAFDVGEFKEYKMTVQILLPEALGGAGKSDGGSGESPVFVINAEGQTAFEANRKLREYLPKRPFYGNTMSAIIGEDLARQGVMPVLNILETDHEFRRSTQLFLATGQGGKVLEAKIRVMANPGDIPMGFVQTLPGISTTVTQNAGDFISQAVGNTMEPVMPVIRVIEADPEIGENPEVRVAGTAAFKKDKLVGFLDEKESGGLLWVLGRVDGVISFQAAKTNESVTIELTRSSSSIEALIDESGNLSVNINIRTEGNLADQTGFADLADPKIRRSIERRLAETIRQEIKSTLNKAQKELKTDVFGFGEVFFRTYPRLWSDTLEPQWDDIYPYIPVNIYVEAHVRRTNLTIEAPVVGGN